MMTSSRPKTTATYNYSSDRVLYSHTLGGIHFVFITIWPDSVVRAWLENDIKQVDRSTPVVLFTHDQPEAQVPRQLELERVLRLERPVALGHAAHVPRRLTDEGRRLGRR